GAPAREHAGGDTRGVRRRRRARGRPQTPRSARLSTGVGAPSGPRAHGRAPAYRASLAPSSPGRCIERNQGVTLFPSSMECQSNSVTRDSTPRSVSAPRDIGLAAGGRLDLRAPRAPGGGLMLIERIAPIEDPGLAVRGLYAIG